MTEWNKRIQVIVAAAVLAAMIFAVDYFIPLGVAVGVGYLLVVLLTLSSPVRSDILLFASVCSLLTVLGFIHSPEGGVLWMVLTNRILALVAIWSAAIVGLQRKRGEDIIRKLNETLEQRVAKRTAKLETINTELKETKEWVRQIIEVIPDGILVVDKSGHIISSNTHVEKIFGYSKEELIGQAVEVLLPETLRQHHVALRTKYMEQPVTRAMGANQNFMALHRNGHTFPVEVALSPLRRKSSMQLIVCIRDITDRKEIEREKYELEMHLRQQQKLESIGTLAGGVAHEINNPITGIMNYAQLISERLDPDSPLREFADEIGREIDRVATIVHNLLTFARDEKESHSPARLIDIVNNTVSLIGTIIRRDQIVLEVDVPDDLPKVLCRNQQIQQVLMNLFTNARDALNERYPEYDPNKIMILTVRPLKLEGKLWLRTMVEDHGCGIPDEIRDNLFDPFFTTKDRARGTGLGLSISHGIIQDHHGKLSYECEAGRYTRFYFDLQVDNGWSLDEAPGE